MGGFGNGSRLYAVHRQRKPCDVKRYMALMAKDLCALSHGGRSGLRFDAGLDLCLLGPGRRQAVSDLCAERQALVLSGVVGSHIEKHEGFSAGDRAVASFDGRHLNYSAGYGAVNGMGFSSDHLYSFDEAGALRIMFELKSQNGSHRQEVYGEGAGVDVKDPVFQATLYDLGWPSDLVAGLRTQSDVVRAVASDPFLKALSDRRVPFGASREDRIAAAKELVPEILETGRANHGRDDARSLPRAETLLCRFDSSPAAAEAAACVRDEPVIGIVEHEGRRDPYRTRRGLGAALREWYDGDAGAFDTERMRLVMPGGLDETSMRAAHGAICDAKGVPDGGFEAWRQSRIRPVRKRSAGRPRGSRSLPDTGAIERNAQVDAGEQYD